jgi:hypothetical protein
MVAKQNAAAVLAGLQRWTVDLNHVMGWISSGLAGGLVAGGLARLAMRGVALVAGQRAEFSLMGTILILLLFAVIGALLALPYLALRHWLPWRTSWHALLYGALLAGLTAWPFFQTGDGELGIVAPWLGASLFAPIPLVYSGVLEVMLRRQEQRDQPAQRVAGYWFGGWLLALLFAFLRIISGLDSYIRTPAALQKLYVAMGIEFGAMQEINGLIGFLFALLYCALCILLFRSSYQRSAGAASAIGLLLFAGLILPANTRGLNARAGGFSPVGEWLIWGLALLLVLGSLWLVRRTALARPSLQHTQTLRWLAAAIGLTGGAFLLMWGAILLVPGLQLRRFTALQTALATPLFWWPWLFGPLTLFYAVRRHRLWR